LSRTANCFFAVALFSAGAPALAQEQAGRGNGPSEGRPDDLPNMQTKHFGLVTHGGAGTIERSKMTPEREREYRAGIERGLSAGYGKIRTRDDGRRRCGSVWEEERGGFCRAKIFLYKGTLGCFGKGKSGREKRRIGR